MSALCVLRVGADDVTHQAVADHVRVREIAEPDPLDSGEDTLHLQEARILAVGEVDLRLVARDHRPGIHAEPREEHLHLHPGGVLRFVQDDERVGQRAASHVGQRRDLDRAVLDRDRKSTRLNSSHSQISYAVFCLKKKNNHTKSISAHTRLNGEYKERVVAWCDTMLALDIDNVQRGIVWDVGAEPYMVYTLRRCCK